MISAVKLFVAQCDNCKEKIFDATQHPLVADINKFKDRMLEARWHTEPHPTNSTEKHYCEKCFNGFDIDDNLVLNKHRFNAE